MQKLREAILANLPVGLLIIGGDGKIIEASPSACEILGCPVQGFVGNSWGEMFLTEKKNHEFTEVVLEAIQKEVPRIQRTTPYFTPDGTRKYLSVISTAQREDGKISAIIVLIEDLTELRELHEREKDILAQNHRLATERAESLVAFARSVAHQIRNPIMAIAGFSRLLERKADETTREPLEAIVEETKKLENMVKSVAEYSAITIETMVPVNVWIIIQEAKHRIDHHPAIVDKPITWQTECPDMNIVVDHELMALALSEVLLNSAEFAGPDATISVSVQEKDERITVEITDSGPGFTSEGLEMAFDPFYTTKTVGAGMGLTRAKRIVGEHRGSMTVANTDESGAQVRITLPVEPL
ncbi:MAG: ATP-binding protein [Pseudodesulfovibrio sp.]